MGLDLCALGGDGLLAVLDGGDVLHGLAHGPADLPGGGHGDLVAGLHRDGCADRGGRSDGAGGVSVVTGVSLSLGSSLGIGLGLPLAVAGVSDGVSGVSSDSHGGGGGVSHSDGGGGDTSGDNLGLKIVWRKICLETYLAIVTNHSGAVSGLGAGLLAGGGDDLLAVLSDGGVHDLVVLLVALLPGGHHLAGVAGLHGHGYAFWGRHGHGGGGVAVVTGLSISLSLGSGRGQGGSDKEEDGEKLHGVCVEIWRFHFPPRKNTDNNEEKLP